MGTQEGCTDPKRYNFNCFYTKEYNTHSNIYLRELYTNLTIFLFISEERRMKKVSFSTVTQLFLNDNKLQFLPCDFFLEFPSLQWLDLRNNQLIHLFGAMPTLHSQVSKLMYCVPFMLFL